MIDFSAFADELVKIATEGFKPLDAEYVGVQVKAQLPIVNRLSKSPKAAKRQLTRALNDPDVPAVLGYRNIVVPENKMPNMTAMGFKPTRIATPLPGERPLAISYRSGRLHAHKLGPAFLIHQDKESPMGEGGGYLSRKALKHGLREGIPSIIKRVRERDALVLGVKNDQLHRIQ